MTRSILKLALFCVLGLNLAQAQDGHKHDKAIAGPKGGKVLEVEGGHAEFWVQPDRKVSVIFYDEAMKPVPAGAREVKVVAEAKTGKAELAMEKAGEALLSKTPLPAGDGYRVVVLIRRDASAKPQNFRIDYHAEICSGCKLAEYACTCSHAGEGGGHGH